MSDDPGILRELPEHVLRCYESLRLTLRSVNQPDVKKFSSQKLRESATVLLRWGKHLKKHQQLNKSRKGK